MLGFPPPQPPSSSSASSNSTLTPLSSLSLSASNPHGSSPVFSNNMGKKYEPVITKCKDSENWTKVTFKPDLAKFNMTHLEDDVVVLMKKRVIDLAGCLGKTVKVELNGDGLSNGIAQSMQPEIELAYLLEEKNMSLAAIQAAHESEINNLGLELEKERDKLANIQLKLQEELKLNKFCQEELNLSKVDKNKNMEAEKQVKFFQGCVGSAFAERDHSIMENTVRKEAATITAVFPSPKDVMSILVQRVLEQRLTTLLDKLLIKPSLVNPPTMEEGGLLLYLRMLAVAYEKTQELARELHAVGCGDLDVEAYSKDMLAGIVSLS
ncbi:unnamed protein product [Camellia sinensis]